LYSQISSFARAVQGLNKKILSLYSLMKKLMF
jgi:hypothetical protein